MNDRGSEAGRGVSWADVKGKRFNGSSDSVERVEYPGSGSSPNPQMIEMENGRKFSLMIMHEEMDGTVEDATILKR